MKDIDNDGKSDIITTNLNSNSVSILRNTSSNGIPSLAAKIDLAVGTQPYSLAVGDLDNDGKFEIITAAASSNTISIWQNNTTNSTLEFNTRSEFRTGSTPKSVSVGDLDGDGKLDIAVANSTSNSVSVFLNTSKKGSINLTLKVDYVVGNSPNFVTISDIDGDGKLDIITSNNSSNSVSILKNTTINGTFSLSTKTDFTTGSQPAALCICDLNNDNKPDIAVTNTGSNSISLFRNVSSNGIINFIKDQEISTGTNPVSISASDFDGDSQPDLVVANLNTNSISILRNTNSSNIISFNNKIDFSTSNNPYSVISGDIDGDGLPDIATANYNSNTVSILKNTPIDLLPVTITNFIAYEKDYDIEVEWNTSRELNISHYELEKSSNGINFIKISSVIANGNISYRWTDKTSISDINYYRLKLVNSDGTYSYTKIIQVISTSKKSTLTVLSNPIKDKKIKLQLSNWEVGNYNVMIFNSNGQLVFKESLNIYNSGESLKVISLGSISSGKYIMVINDNEHSFTKNIFIE